MTDIRIGYNGKTYSSAGNAVREQIKPLDNIQDIINTKLYDSFTYTLDNDQYISTNFYLKADMIYKIRAIGNKSTVRIYIEGDTTNTKDLSVGGSTYTFIPKKSGILRLNNTTGWSSGDTITIELVGEVYNSKEVVDFYNDIWSDWSGLLGADIDISKYLTKIHTAYSTSILIKAGNTYLITNSSSNTYNVYSDIDTDNFATLNQNATIAYKPQKTGLLRFYFLTGSDMSAKISIKGNLLNTVNTLESQMSLINNTLAPLSFDINTLVLSASLKHYPNSSLSPSVGETSINDYNNNIIESQFGDIYAPFRIRDNNGKLLYNLRCDGVKNLNDNHTLAWGFGKDGKYLKRVYAEHWKTEEGQGIFDDDIYFILINEYKNPHNVWSQRPVNIEWLNPSTNITYTVGNGGNYSTFLGMLNDLKDNTNKKTVYILPGEYDIWEEYGGDEYFKNLQDASSLNWRDVCPVVPPNTHIIGIGEVTLKFMPTPEQIGDQAKAFLFSPLNVSGTCTIENIKIECQNCRYAIHDETSGISEFDGATHIFKNVRAYHHGGTYGVRMTYGAGHNRKMHFEFKDCEFWSYSGAASWSSHDWPAAKEEASTFIFDNCLFIHPNNPTADAFRLSTSSKVDRLDNIRLSNCYISTGKAVFSSEDTSGTQYTQGYDVTLIGCNKIDWSWGSYIPEEKRIKPKQYNVIPNEKE